MSGLLGPVLGGKRLLVAIAAPAEASAALTAFGSPHADHPRWRLIPLPGHVDLVVTGIGKVNAAAAVARTLDPARHAGVLSAGVAGALSPQGPGTMALGQSIAATRCIYADEGVITEQGLQTCAQIGFPLGPFEGNAIEVPAPWLSALAPLCDRTGPIATVSTCSGTDDAARQVAARTGALAEAMEGAAVAHVAACLGLPAAEVRVISNTTGERSRQRWDLRGALAGLAAILGRLGVYHP